MAQSKEPSLPVEKSFGPEDAGCLEDEADEHCQASKGTFKIDSAISCKFSNGRSSEEAELTPWDGGDGEDEGFDLVANSEANGWDPHDMFLKNKVEYGVRTSFQPSLEGYTVQLQKEDTPEYRNAEQKATEVANEILSNPRRRSQMETVNGEDEEDCHAAVVRAQKPAYQHGTGKYPPGNKTKTFRPTPPSTPPESLRRTTSPGGRGYASRGYHHAAPAPAQGPGSRGYYPRHYYHPQGPYDPARGTPPPPPPPAGRVFGPRPCGYHNTQPPAPLQGQLPPLPQREPRVNGLERRRHQPNALPSPPDEVSPPPVEREEDGRKGQDPEGAGPGYPQQYPQLPRPHPGQLRPYRGPRPAWRPQVPRFAPQHEAFQPPPAAVQVPLMAASAEGAAPVGELDANKQREMDDMKKFSQDFKLAAGAGDQEDGKGQSCPAPPPPPPAAPAAPAPPEPAEDVAPVADALNKSTLNPNAKEFVYNPDPKPVASVLNDRVGAQQPPSTPTSPGQRTPQYTPSPGVPTQVMPPYIGGQREAMFAYQNNSRTTNRFRRYQGPGVQPRPTALPVPAVHMAAAPGGQPLVPIPSALQMPFPLPYGPQQLIPAQPYQQLVSVVADHGGAAGMLPLQPATMGYFPELQHHHHHHHHLPAQPPAPPPPPPPPQVLCALPAQHYQFPPQQQQQQQQHQHQQQQHQQHQQQQQRRQQPPPPQHYQHHHHEGQPPPPAMVPWLRPVLPPSMQPHLFHHQHPHPHHHQQ
ncbi:ataxin-2-like protein isoform X2 [Bacillus rossius redtenbacheri]|uniref:ataxin-2-like protein isoform X2 n=1 Tax=Bacillus rossius redtenbacheri TaxID=93214 RepID=UPI002FDD222F